jgi:hypothetical protein
MLVSVTVLAVAERLFYHRTPSVAFFALRLGCFGFVKGGRGLHELDKPRKVLGFPKFLEIFVDERPEV